LDPLFAKYSALGRVTDIGSSNAEDDKKFIDFIFHLKDQGQIYEEEEEEEEEEEVKESYKKKEVAGGELSQEVADQITEMLEKEEKKHEETNVEESFKTALDTQPLTDESFYSFDECYSTLRTLGASSDDQLPNSRLVLAIIPFGVTGSGKSTFFNTLAKVAEKLKWTLSSISSDTVRKGLMDKLM
jgi:signal recognition particle GTPase